MKFQKYRRTNIAKMRPVTQMDIAYFINWGRIPVDYESTDESDNISVSISDEDLKNDSPQFGDMIARNPKNHNDQWLVAEQYFKDNFELHEDELDIIHNDCGERIEDCECENPEVSPI